MASDEERRLILEMIESGRITPEQGLNLLQALESGESAAPNNLLEPAGIDELEEAPAQPAETPRLDDGFSLPHPGIQAAPPSELPHEETAKIPPDFEDWRRLAWLPLGIGIVILVAGGLLMYQALSAQGVGFWFVCASLPFLIGLAAVIFGWRARTARWLHLRVYQKEGEWPRTIRISFPMPLRLAAWFLRRFRGRIHGLDNTSLDEVLLALDDSTTPAQPLYIEVDEGEDGEKVQIYIG